MRIQNHYQMIGAAEGMISPMQLRMFGQTSNYSVSFYLIISRPKRFKEKEVHKHARRRKSNQLQKKHIGDVPYWS